MSLVVGDGAGEDAAHSTVLGDRSGGVDFASTSSLHRLRDPFSRVRILERTDSTSDCAGLHLGFCLLPHRLAVRLFARESDLHDSFSAYHSDRILHMT